MIRYVALGDSYTIGTAVAPEDAFPTLLVEAVPALELVANLGVNGYSTVDLIRDELPAFAQQDPGFATVLIGVNDAVQGIPTATYTANLTTIFDVLLATLPVERVVVVTVPDYTVTPAGADYGDPAVRSSGIRANNATMTRLAAERGIAVVDIHDISLEAAVDATLVAADGLHPSGAQYRRPPEPSWWWRRPSYQRRRHRERRPAIRWDRSARAAASPSVCSPIRSALARRSPCTPCARPRPGRSCATNHAEASNQCPRRPCSGPGIPGALAFCVRRSSANHPDRE